MMTSLQGANRFVTLKVLSGTVCVINDVVYLVSYSTSSWADVIHNDVVLSSKTGRLGLWTFCRLDYNNSLPASCQSITTATESFRSKYCFEVNLFPNFVDI